MPLAMDEGRDLEQAAKLGRGTLPAGIASMNRSIVTIEPALAGWVVSFEGQALQVLPRKLEAIGFASRRAAEQTDRQRVVKGKRVAGSVDCGGGRTHNKK